MRSAVNGLVITASYIDTDAIDQYFESAASASSAIPAFLFNGLSSIREAAKEFVASSPAILSIHRLTISLNKIVLNSETRIERFACSARCNRAQHIKARSLSNGCVFFGYID